MATKIKMKRMKTDALYRVSGGRLKRAIESSGMTQREVAALVGWDESRLSRIVSSRGGVNLRGRTIGKLKRVLKPEVDFVE